jgi:hypothetical protein
MSGVWIGFSERCLLASIKIRPRWFLVSVLFQRGRYLDLNNPYARVYIHPTLKLYLQGLKDGSGRAEFSYDQLGDLVAIGGVKIALNNALPVFNSAAPTAGQVVTVAGDAKRGLNYLDGGTYVHLITERFLPDALVAAAVVEHRLAVQRWCGWIAEKSGSGCKLRTE